MADIDFSHAVLDVVGAAKPLTHSAYLTFLENNLDYLLQESLDTISRPTRTILTNTPTKVSILYTGTITWGNSSGTSFYIGSRYDFSWSVSNISYSIGDSYSFIIDIEVEGNT